MYAATVLSDSPIAYWRLGESSGASAADSSGNGHGGNYTGGVTLNAAGALFGDPDPAARFDGVNDSVQVPDASELHLNSDWTIEFWARQLSYANTLPGILEKGDSTGPHGYAIWADSSGDLWFQRHNREADSGNGALTSSYRYFVVTYDGTNARWYVDGTLESTTSINLPTNNGSATLELGRAASYGNNDLDEVAIYDNALTAARVSAHYAAGS